LATDGFCEAVPNNPVSPEKTPVTNAAAAPLGSAQRTRVVDQNLSHRAGHNREKMCTVGEFGLRMFEQLYVGFIDQSCGLERMTGQLAAKKQTRNPAQLPIDERHQFVQRTVFSRAHLFQENCDPRRRPLWGGLHT